MRLTQVIPWLQMLDGMGRHEITILLEMIDGIEIEIGIYIEEVIDDVQGRPGTEVLDHLDANSK